MRADIGETYYIVTAGYGFEDVASVEHETIEAMREDVEARRERGAYFECYEIKRIV